MESQGDGRRRASVRLGLRARLLAALGSAWGLACALYIAQFRFRSDQANEPLSGGLANTAFWVGRSFRR